MSCVHRVVVVVVPVLPGLYRLRHLLPSGVISGEVRLPEQESKKSPLEKRVGIFGFRALISNSFSVVRFPNHSYCICLVGSSRANHLLGLGAF